MNPRRLLIIIAILGGIVFLVMALTRKKKASDGGGTTVAPTAKIDVPAVPRAVEQAVSIPAGDQSARFLAMTSDAQGALKSVTLHTEQYQRPKRTGSRWVPAERLEAGPYDVVTTWDPDFYPFRLDFSVLGWDGQEGGGTITRLVRGATTATPIEGRPKAFKLGAPTADDLPLAPGDRLQGTGLDKGLAILAADGDVVELEAAPAAALPPGLTVTRTTSPLRQLAMSDRFTRATGEDPNVITWVWPNPHRDTSDLWIERSWRVTGPYQLGQTVAITNTASAPLKVHYAVLVTGWQDPEAEAPGMFSAPTEMWQPICTVADERHSHTLHDLVEDREKGLIPNGQVSFFGVETQYFVMAGFFPGEGGRAGSCSLHGEKNGAIVARYEAVTTHDTLPGPQCLPEWFPADARAGRLTCVAAMQKLGVDATHLDEHSLDLAMDRFASSGSREEAIALRKTLRAYGEARAARFELSTYAGPKDLDVLATAGGSLDKSLDFGWVAFLARPLLAFLKFIHSVIPSWVVAILLFTIIVRLCLYPLTHRQYQQMQKMSALKPEMDSLRERFKDDSAKLQQETMSLYKRHGVNPLSGCFPLLVQMPVFFAMYRTLYTAVDLYQEPLFLWVKDMTQPDPYFILPVILGVVMVGQQLMTPMTGMDPTQAKIMKWVMPIMFSGFMLFLPSGLVFYIFVGTILSMGQQWYTRRRYTATVDANRSKDNDRARGTDRGSRARQRARS